MFFSFFKSKLTLHFDSQVAYVYSHCILSHQSTLRLRIETRLLASMSLIVKAYRELLYL